MGSSAGTSATLVDERRSAASRAVRRNEGRAIATLPRIEHNDKRATRQPVAAPARSLAVFASGSHSLHHQTAPTTMSTSRWAQ